MLFSPGEYSRLKSGGKWKTADCELNCSQSVRLLWYSSSHPSPPLGRDPGDWLFAGLGQPANSSHSRQGQVTGQHAWRLALALVPALRSLNFPGYHFYPLYKGHLVCPSYCDNQRRSWPLYYFIRAAVIWQTGGLNNWNLCSPCSHDLRSRCW